MTNPRINEIRYQLIRQHDAEVKLQGIRRNLTKAIDAATNEEWDAARAAFKAYLAERQDD